MGRDFIINLSLLVGSTIFSMLLFAFVLNPMIYHYRYGEGNLRNDIHIDTEFTKDFNLKDIDDLNADDTFILLDIGDSVTEGDCPNTKMLQDRMDLNLTPLEYEGVTYSHVNVLNGGKGSQEAHSIYNIYEAILNTIPKKPNLVTVLTGWNEHWYRHNECEFLHCFDSPEINALFKLDHVSSIQKCRQCADSYQAIRTDILSKERERCYQKILDYGPENIAARIDHFDFRNYRQSLDEYEYSLMRIINLSKANGIEVVFVVPPNGLVEGALPKMSVMDCTLLDADNYLKIHLIYTQKIREIAWREGIPLIDLEEVFYNTTNRLDLFDDVDFDPIHPNDKGRLVCTDTFYDFLLDYLSSK